MKTFVANVEDLRRMARRKLPRALFDYIDRGSYEEITYHANSEALRAIEFRQRVLVDATDRCLKTTLLGEAVSLPVAIAPTGLTGFFHGEGEILAARAAQALGTRFCLSTMSVCAIEDVRAATKAPFWFQLYVFRDRGFTRSLIERARAAACSALFVTVDLPVIGQRHQDVRNGFTVPPRFTLRGAADVIAKPQWALGVMFGRRHSFGNIEAHVAGKNVLSVARWANENFDRTLSWRDLDWIRSLWPGKLVLKGILDAEDARAAVSAGADGIVVSNHGGRQLDGAPASIRVLPEVASAVGDRIEILFDGGVRTGQDVLRALALGARGCLIGRAHLYGLAAMGEAGVSKVIEIIGKELEVTMALTGVRDVRAVSAEILRNPPESLSQSSRAR